MEHVFQRTRAGAKHLQILEYVKEKGLKIVRDHGGNNIDVEGPDKQLIFIYQW